MTSTQNKALSVAAIRAAQAARLTRLRTVLELGLAEAADMGGMSRHKWSRMERALADVNGVHLARFAQAAGVPAEYVMTGSFLGLSDQLIRNLAAVEAREKAVAAGRMAAEPDRPRRGRPRRKNTAHIERAAQEEAAAPAGGSASVPERRALRKVS